MIIPAPYRSYPGGKGASGVLQKIINRVPPIDVYAELCAGNGTVFRHLRLPAETWLNDIDPDVVKAWQKSLHKITNIPPNGQTASFYTIGNTNLTLTNYDVRALYKGDLFKAIPGKTRLLYLDVPYLKSTRLSQRDIYNFEWDETDHCNFIDSVKGAECLVIISHHPCELYDTLLANENWKKTTFQYRHRGGTVTDALYWNFPAPSVLQDWRYLGDNYRERENIKDKTARWLTNLNEMPEPDRVSIISNIVNKYKEECRAIIQ